MNLSDSPEPMASSTNAASEVLLRLYISGATPMSSRAVVNTRTFCEQHLKGRYVLEIVSIADNLPMATKDQIVVAPTLLKIAPLPIRRFIGDMSDPQRVQHALRLNSTE